MRVRVIFTGKGTVNLGGGETVERGEPVTIEADPERVDAMVKSGVLRIVPPKRAKVKGRKRKRDPLEVNAGDPRQETAFYKKVHGWREARGYYQHKMPERCCATCHWAIPGRTILKMHRVTCQVTGLERPERHTGNCNAPCKDWMKKKPKEGESKA